MRSMDDTERQRVRQDAARQTLRSWGKRQRSQAAERDPMVIGAFAAGVSKEEIHMDTGLGRSTIDRIIARAPGAAENQPST